MSTVTITCI